MRSGCGRKSPAATCCGIRRPTGAAIADRIGAATLNVDQKRQTADSVAEYRATGRPVLSYTVNDADRARTLFGWGVSAVFTDAPGRLARELGADA
nr:glycerophosphodiester phosphodiesterase family protein [Azospirillum sp. INR13]